MKLKFFITVFIFLFSSFGLQNQNVCASEPEISPRYIKCEINDVENSLDELYKKSTYLWTEINQIILKMLDNCMKEGDKNAVTKLYAFVRTMCVWRVSKATFTVECKNFFDMVDYARLHFVNDYLPKVSARDRFFKRMTFSDYEYYLAKKDIKLAKFHLKIAYIPDDFLRNLLGSDNFLRYKNDVETIQEKMALLNCLKMKIQEKLVENVYKKHKIDKISFSIASLELQKELSETPTYQELSMVVKDKNRLIEKLYSLGNPGFKFVPMFNFEGFR